MGRPGFALTAAGARQRRPGELPCADMGEELADGFGVQKQTHSGRHCIQPVERQFGISRGRIPDTRSKMHALLKESGYCACSAPRGSRQSSRVIRIMVTSASTPARAPRRSEPATTGSPGCRVLKPDHSSRSNRAGSINIERRAGIHVAIRHSKAIVNMVPASTKGSCGVAS